jgi:hypothetical protein
VPGPVGGLGRGKVASRPRRTVKHRTDSPARRLATPARVSWVALTNRPRLLLEMCSTGTGSFTCSGSCMRSTLPLQIPATLALARDHAAPQAAMARPAPDWMPISGSQIAATDYWRSTLRPGTGPFRLDVASRRWPGHEATGDFHDVNAQRLQVRIWRSMAPLRKGRTSALGEGPRLNPSCAACVFRRALRCFGRENVIEPASARSTCDGLR